MFMSFSHSSLIKGHREEISKVREKNTNIPPEVPDRLTVIMDSSGAGSLCMEHLMINPNNNCS